MSAPAVAAPETRVFGIRHHGPGSARSVRAALERFRPDHILIEGPADADPLVAYVAAEGMTPPVALLAYVPDSPARAAFWPFAAFSPEWQTLHYAVQNSVPVSFCDLPATHVLAMDHEPGDRTDPLAALSAAAGYDDPERWWDAIIESGSDADTFDAITEAMSVLRESAITAPNQPLTSPRSSPSNHATEGAPRHSGAHLAGTHSAAEDPGQKHAGTTSGTSAGTTSRTPTGTTSRTPTGITSGISSEMTTETSTGMTSGTSTGMTNGTPADVSGAAVDAVRDPVDSHTLVREAYMRQAMRKALKNGARRLAVVCGAWHAPALAGKLGPATADARLLKGLPKGKATLTWVPWTHSRLIGASGYGAGITSPGWYHHLFTQTEQPIARWLTKVAAPLRTHDLPVSSAHIIESVRLAETLAAMRGRPLAGLSEVTDATRAVLCEGDETMLRLVVTELVVGEALGSVPEDTPTVPLDADLRAQARTLRLKQQALAQQLDLDLRKERERARSHLLHRLRLLGIDWGTPTSSEVRSTGTFRETWTLRWEPELSVAIVEASRWGTTIRTAAEAKILDAVAAPRATVGEVSAALESALLADLGGAIDGLVARLESVAALDHDVTHLLTALPALIRTLRYGDVRGTDLTALAHVADGLLVRICAGLPSAVTGLDADAAAALRAQLDAAHLAIATRDDAWATGEWLTALRALADRADVHGALVGRAVRLLCDAGILDDRAAARRLAAALSVGHTPAEKAAWVDGFLGGRGLLLVHDRELLRLIDDWLRGLDEDQFVATLPLLRRTFGAFEAGERQAIAQALGGGAPARRETPGRTDFDIERGTLALAAVTEILAVAR
ncbi:DUF5682 family protein [Nocardia terpenica]|uniref:Uncharacterized protein n=1 Tax=Nocardia terpenica TaxID=455432 RepID=A0A164KLC8_9NOCA|nr:DUF5682 family protein [Nocardia terpenica]KZM71512.1 hypothetical protein AWN90_01835 [Nocardia terpenica]